MRTLTPRQAKYVKLIKENLTAKGLTKSEGEIMLEAGYSEEKSKQPSRVRNSQNVKPALQSFIDQLDDKRRLAITYITPKKLAKAPARDNAYIVDILTKNHQLLGGQPTELLKISPEEKAEVDRVFSQNSIIEGEIVAEPEKQAPQLPQEATKTQKQPNTTPEIAP